MRNKDRKVPEKKTKQNRRSDRDPPAALPQIRPKVAGIDLGSREHWVCAPTKSEEKPNVRTFGTTMPHLRKLAHWLRAEGVESAERSEGAGGVAVSGEGVALREGGVVGVARDAGEGGGPPQGARAAVPVGAGEAGGESRGATETFSQALPKKELQDLGENRTGS